MTGKRIGIPLFLAVVLGLCSCAETGNGVSSDTRSMVAATAVTDNASIGVIPELDFKLGDALETIKTKFPGYHDEDEQETDETATAGEGEGNGEGEGEEGGDAHDHGETLVRLTTKWRDKNITRVAIEKENDSEVVYSTEYFLMNNRLTGGIVCIGTFSDAFGFSPQITLLSDVKSVLGAPIEEGAPTELEGPALPILPDGCIRLIYQYGDYKLTFFFVEDFLYATNLENTTVWNP